MSITAEGWIVGVERIPVPNGHGGHVGGTWARQPYKWLWHTTEGPTIEGALSTYPQTRAVPHLTWEPETGRIAQHISFAHSATALRNQAGGVETNRDGVIQVEVVGFARQPFTDGPMKGLATLRDAWRALGIPEVFPAGRPLAYPQSYGNNGQRSKTRWAEAGHFCHSQAPENDHGDPGNIEPTRLWGTAPPPIPQPPTTEDDEMFLLQYGHHTLVWSSSTFHLAPVPTAEGIAKYKQLGAKDGGSLNDGDYEALRKASEVSGGWDGTGLDG